MYLREGISERRDTTTRSAKAHLLANLVQIEDQQHLWHGLLTQLTLRNGPHRICKGGQPNVSSRVPRVRSQLLAVPTLSPSHSEAVQGCYVHYRCWSANLPKAHDRAKEGEPEQDSCLPLAQVQSTSHSIPERLALPLRRGAIRFCSCCRWSVRQRSGTSGLSEGRVGRIVLVDVVRFRCTSAQGCAVHPCSTESASEPSRS